MPFSRDAHGPFAQHFRDNIRRDQTNPFEGPTGPFVPKAFGVPPGPTGRLNLESQHHSGTARALSNTVLPFIQNAAPQILPTGFETLSQIIASQGQIDPALMNRELADISRTTQQQQDALIGQQAQFGLNSPAFAALNAAIGQSGADQRADRIAQENVAAAERARSDLVNVLLPLLIDPALASQAGLFGVPTGSDGPSDFEALLAAAGPIIAAAI